MEEDPFPELNIGCSKFLDAVKGRSKCSKCQRSRKYYCYTCYLPIPELSDQVPKVKLPLKIDIIKHPSEVDGKSTAVHAGVIAPDDVTIYTYPVIPDYKNKERVSEYFRAINPELLIAIVFPGENSLTLTQLAAKHRHISDKCDTGTDLVGKRKRERTFSGDTESECRKSVKTDKSQKINESLETEQTTASDKHNNDSDLNHSEELVKDVMDIADKGPDMKAVNGNRKSDDDWFLERVIFIDSTWNQTKSIYGDERLKDLQCIHISDHKTRFWRHHKDNPETYLSTIEAIYYFICDFHEKFVCDTYKDEYDNLLFFFKYMYGKIRHLYDGGENLMAYKNKKNLTTRGVDKDT